MATAQVSPEGPRPSGFLNGFAIESGQKPSQATDFSDGNLIAAETAFF